MEKQAHCPNCGDIALDKIILHNAALRKQLFEHSPILPTCAACAAEVTVAPNLPVDNIILLTGTCGSGKSAVAGELARNHGYMAIDGDCVIQVVKYKQQTNQVWSNSAWIIEEIGREIDILSAYSRNIVISHVVQPQEIDGYANVIGYRQVFEAKSRKHKFVLLRPKYETALERANTRTCHASPTDEKWVRNFYDKLNGYDDGVITYDNTNDTVEQTAAAVLSL